MVPPGEQLAARIEQSWWMPNAILLKDHRHASRRILMCPWVAYGLWGEALNMCSAGSQCVTQIIQHGNIHQYHFNTLIQHTDVDDNVAPASSGRNRDLKSALHRFESHLEPL